MMVEDGYRELEEIEKRICEKQLKKYEGEIKHLEWLLEYNQLMLNKGLRMNYEEKVREFKEQNNALMEDMKMSLVNKRILLDQLKNGIKIRQKEETPTGIN